MANEIIEIRTQLTENYVEDIRAILQKAREYTYRTINNVMVQAYWLIGERIVRQEQKGKDRADYGAYIVKQLSQELTKDFGTGFSIANLKNMRQFYRTFPDREISYTLCSQLSVSKYLPYMPTEEEIRRQIELKKDIK